MQNIQCLENPDAAESTGINEIQSLTVIKQPTDVCMRRGVRDFTGYHQGTGHSQPDAYDTPVLTDQRELFAVSIQPTEARPEKDVMSGHDGVCV
jgi:hypothetical protein